MDFDKKSMKNIKKYKIVSTTTSSLEEAQRIKLSLLNSKLTPCVHLLNNLESSYIWNEKIVTDKEVLLMIKTTQDNYLKVKTIIRKNHSYHTPEIVSYDFEILSNSYRDWFEKNIEV
tara:strand:- start:87 stop:437 length:351 start_codon:yes stop_codon:yes gene_type:complete